jgi:hypothetical protein
VIPAGKRAQQTVQATLGRNVPLQSATQRGHYLLQRGRRLVLIQPEAAAQLPNSGVATRAHQHIK